MVQTLLESEGYSTESFADGKLALERLRSNPESCLILLDLLMPVMTGWEFMEEFQKLPVTVVPIPVYLFSVVETKEGEPEKMGATGFVKKPVKLDLLLQIVDEHCKSAKKAA
jgi:CheY-like chemotaxis protein